jgi:hypothetical protein
LCRNIIISVTVLTFKIAASDVVFYTLSFSAVTSDFVTSTTSPFEHHCSESSISIVVLLW